MVPPVAVPSTSKKAKRRPLEACFPPERKACALPCLLAGLGPAFMTNRTRREKCNFLRESPPQKSTKVPVKQGLVSREAYNQPSLTLCRPTEPMVRERGFMFCSTGTSTQALALAKEPQARAYFNSIKSLFSSKTCLHLHLGHLFSPSVHRETTARARKHKAHILGLNHNKNEQTRLGLWESHKNR